MKYFIQIGANDGSQQDFIPPDIKKEWKGILIEPIPYYFDKLKQTYSGYDNLIFENIAIFSSETVKSIYYIDPAFIDNNLPSWAHGIGSFSVDHIKKHFENAPIRQQNIPCIPLSTLIKKHNIPQVDLLVIDTEGYDYEILKSIDMDNVKPKEIIYEEKHLNNNDKKEAINYLKTHGYTIATFTDEFGNDNIRAKSLDCCLATFCNKEFLIGLEVLLTSLVENNSNIDLDFVVMTNDLSDEDLERCRKIYPHIEKIIINVSKYSKIKKLLEESGRKECFNTFFKLEAFSLPYDRVIFLDSDLLVVGDISELTNLNCYFAAVLDKEIQKHKFNSGVMVIGGKYLNCNTTNGLINIAIQMIKNDSADSDFYQTSISDQSVLNKALENNWMIMPEEYNLLKFYYKQRGSSMANVKIIHYVMDKPWKTFSCEIASPKYNVCPVAVNIWREYYCKMLQITNSQEKQVQGDCFIKYC